MQKMIIAVFAALVLLSAGAAPASVPHIWGVWSWDYDEPVQLMVTPGGNGPAFSDASFQWGGTADATIRIQIWVENWGGPNGPLAGFPAEDLWFEAPGLTPCVGGSIADADTDDQGWVVFSLPPNMGGCTENPDDPAGLNIYIMGDLLRDADWVPIAPNILVNSPDINGDLTVNLADVGMFSSDFFGAYSFRSDFYWDGVLNLADVGRMATGVGGSCP